MVIELGLKKINRKFTAYDFKAGDEFNKDDMEWFDVTSVREFWDSHGKTYIAVGGWYTVNFDREGTEGTYGDVFWPIDKFNRWVQGTVKVHEGTTRIIPHLIQKTKTIQKSVSPMDEVNKAFAESKKTLKL